jgi:hypothetical protein
MTTIGSIRAVGMAAAVSLCVVSCKPQLNCRMASGGSWFPVTTFSEISEAAAAEKGSLQCDVVYRIGTRSYVMGGCNRSYVGLWAKKEGRLGGTAPRARRELVCKE